MFHDFQKLQQVNLTYLKTFDFIELESPNEFKHLDLSQHDFKNINFTSKFGAYESLEFLNLQKNNLNVLYGISHATFPELLEIGLSRNRLSSKYLWNDGQIWRSSAIHVTKRMIQGWRQWISCRKHFNFGVGYWVAL